MNKPKIIIAVIITLTIGAASFYGGMKYANSKKPTANFLNNANRFQQAGQRGGNRMPADFINGEIIKKDNKSITLKLNDGGSRIIFLADKSEIAKFVSGNFKDLEIGKQVMVNGTANNDGSLTAKLIQIRPENLPTKQ